MSLPDNVNVVWRPIPNSSQELALICPCDEVLYTGARGPGKTDTQLFDFRKNVGRGYGRFWRGVIFDRNYKNLEDIISKSKRWFYSFRDGARFLESKADMRWIWPTGEELLFRSVKKDGDYWNFHGHEYPWIGWNELTKFPTAGLYDSMMSTNRSSFTPEKDSPINEKGERILLPPIPLRVFSTCNPWGPGHAWVKRRFIDKGEYGEVVKTTCEITNPKTKLIETVTRTQVSLFGSYVENIYLDPKYIAILNSETDENKRKAWLEGDWNIVAGGALDDVWSKKAILPRFVIPESWPIDRAYDDGSSHPFSVGWFAEANGESAIIVYNGQEYEFCPPKGTLIQIAEWYGTKEIGTNKGLKLSSRVIAETIKEKEKILRASGWIKGNVRPGPADNRIRQVTDTDVETTEQVMLSCGIAWEHSDKSAGSRIIGLQLIRNRLEATMKDEDAPRLYFMENCRSSLATLPTLPRNEDNMDDVDTDAEDHVYDMVRYRCLKGARKGVKNLNIGLPF